MVQIFALLFSMAAMASDLDLFEKTYPRDNTFCQIGSQKLEIMIRGDQLRTEPKMLMWGEHIFARVEDGPASLLPVNQESGHYRFFASKPSSCTKIAGTMMGGKFVILFQKHNSPHKHQLVIQYLDPKTLKPLETLHTPFLADKVMARKESFIVRSHPPTRQEIQMGNVVIQGKKYLYQEHRFPLWIMFDKNGFSTEPLTTYENFSYKSFFKSPEEFKRQSGWMDVEKAFTNTTLYVAINHEIKSKCILLTKGKIAINGEESWICQ